MMLGGKEIPARILAMVLLRDSVDEFPKTVLGTPGLGILLSIHNRVSSRSKLKQHVLIKVVPFCIKMNASFVRIISFFLLYDFLSLEVPQLTGSSTIPAQPC